MPDLWLPPEDRLALFDPNADQLRVIGWRPGPAGVSAVDLASGLRVVVDHASPTTLAELAIELRDGRIDADHLDLLAHLLGDDAATTLAALPAARPTTQPTRLDSGNRSVDDLATRRRGQAEYEAIARLTLAADLGGDAALSDTARAVALLEAALTAFDLRRTLALELARQGIDLLERSGWSADPKSGYQIVSLLRSVDERADGALGDSARRLADVVISPPASAAAGAAFDRRQVLRSAAAPSLAPMFAEHGAAPMKAAAAEETVEASRPERPLPVEGDHRGWAWLDEGNHVRVTAPASASGSWARVFRTHDRLLLGLAPLRTSDADGRLHAIVVVPPTDDPNHLTVDVIDDPAAPRRSPVHELTRQAVLTGRRAARLSRLDDPQSDAAWQDCARQWQSLGDTQRANLARRHGRRDDDDRGSPRGRRASSSAPLLADQIR